MTINFRQRWRAWGDRDHWKIVLDPYRDWRRLLFFTTLAIMVIIGFGLYMLLVVEKTHERASSVTASSSAPASLLLDTTAINQAAWFIEAAETLPVPRNGTNLELLHDSSPPFATGWWKTPGRASSDPKKRSEVCLRSRLCRQCDILVARLKLMSIAVKLAPVPYS